MTKKTLLRPVQRDPKALMKQQRYLSLRRGKAHEHNPRELGIRPPLTGVRNPKIGTEGFGVKKPFPPEKGVSSQKILVFLVVPCIDSEFLADDSYFRVRPPKPTPKDVQLPCGTLGE